MLLDLVVVVVVLVVLVMERENGENRIGDRGGASPITSTLTIK